MYWRIRSISLHSIINRRRTVLDQTNGPSIQYLCLQQPVNYYRGATDDSAPFLAAPQHLTEAFCVWTWRPKLAIVANSKVSPILHCSFKSIQAVVLLFLCFESVNQFYKVAPSSSIIGEGERLLCLLSLHHTEFCRPVSRQLTFFQTKKPHML